MVKLKNICKSYEKKNILDNISADFTNPSSIYAIIGKSGSGKTTLLSILFGIDQDFSGEYLFMNENVKLLKNKDWDSKRSKDIQIVYQDFKLLENLTVYENIFFAINDNTPDIDEKIKNALKEMDLEKISDMKVKKISGGEKQRLALARATINSPKVLLLDEPTGNLDDENTKLILNYIKSLKKKDIIVILITHDNRVLDDVDVIYRIDDKSLILEKNNILNKSDSYPKSDDKKYSKSKKVLKYVNKSLARNKKEIIIAYIPVLLIFMAFILIFNIFLVSNIQSIDVILGGVSDRAIVLDLQNTTQEFKNKIAEQKINTINGGDTKLGFSTDDISEIKKISGVKDAETVIFDVTSIADNYNRLLNFKLKKEDLPTIIKNSPGSSKISADLEFSFSTIPMPHKYINDYNYSTFEIMFGDYPTDDTNQVLIPDVLAHLYAEQNGVKIDKIVGTKINLETKDKENNTFKNEYIVSGIYPTNFKNHLEPNQTIYIPYMGHTRGSEYTTDEYILDDYNKFKSMIQELNNPASEEHYKDLLKDFETFKKSYGSSYSQAIVITNSPSDVKSVTQELDKMFPNTVKLSQLDKKYGETSNIYKISIIILISSMLFLALVFGLIITFMNKSLMLRRNKEMSILYSLGYSKKNVMGIIMNESLFMTTITLTASFISLYLINVFYLQYTRNYYLFTDMFSFNNIIWVTLLTLVIIFVSVFWSLLGIKQKKLKSYLE